MPTHETATQILARLEHFGVHQGLEHSRPLLSALGDPQASLPTVLVAGTNGKGSTAALLASMARAAGYRCGLYTSPHLEHVTERVAIDDRLIKDRQLAELLREVLDQGEAIGGHQPTHFEALTLAALLYFQRSQVDLAVLEVGLGGRLDTTNLSEPRISIITRIGLDHEGRLGSTLAEVAAEKAGVMRAARPTLVWQPQAEVTGVFERQAADLGCELVRVDRELRIEPDGHPAAIPQRASLVTPSATYQMALHLPGRHQLNNLALALSAAERLAESGFPKLDKAAIESGGENCRWPGRLEWIALPGAHQVLLDGAHNPAGIDVLADYLDTLEGPIDLLFGALADKKIERMLPPLIERCRKVWLTEPRSQDRTGGLARAAALLGSRVEGQDSRVANALRQALDGCVVKSGGGKLLICGSLFLVGEARRLLRERYGVPAAMGRTNTDQGSPA